MKCCGLFLLLWILPTPAFSQPANSELSRTILRNGEPNIAVNPTNAQNLVVAWMSTSLTGVTISVRSSFDDGATWGDTVRLPHFGTLWQSADVSMAWRADGVLFLSYIDFVPNTTSQGGDYVTSSSNGGQSWGVPIEAIDASADTDLSLDRPWIAVDNNTAATSGNLYLPTKPAPWHPLPNHSFFTRSTDGGTNWEPEIVLDSAPYSATNIQQPMGSPAVASDGTLYIAYPCLGLYSGYALATSHDGGASFTRSFILTPIPDLVDKDSAKEAFHLSADPSNAQHLFFAWLDNRNGDPDVYASSSFDGGGTWSKPVRVNDDPVGDGVVQDMLWPSFGADGTLAIVWRDRRNGARDGDASASDTYFASSSDGGLTWSKNYPLSTQTAPFDSILVDNGNDFMSCAVAKDTLYAAWADTRTDSLRVYFGKVPLDAPSSVAVSQIASTPMLWVSANPGSDEEQVNFTLLTPAACTLSIYDERGTLVRRMDEGELAAGTHSIECPLAGIPSGDYFIELQKAGGSVRAKFTTIQ